MDQNKVLFNYTVEVPSVNSVLTSLCVMRLENHTPEC